MRVFEVEDFSSYVFLSLRLSKAFMYSVHVVPPLSCGYEMTISSLRSVP
jgi:hypothetical protein